MKKVTNIPKNTLYVTPSPMYLGVPSLPEPSTTLLLTKIQIHRYTQFLVSNLDIIPRAKA